MRIAIANDNGMVSQHFGHCAEYTFFEVDNNEIISKKSIQTPPHEPGKLPPFLAGHGANCVIAGGMGGRAQELFAEHGVDVIIGVSGSVDDVIKSYLSGNLIAGESSCDH